MNPITSIYIPRIDAEFNAKFIANVFDRNGIAQVSRVYIEPYSSIMKKNLNGYNRAYIAIKSWHDTETAFNFIERLRNPTREARIVYSDDNWWVVDINNNTTKLASNKRVLTVFEENQNDFYRDDISTTALFGDEHEDFIQVDAEKTKLLRNIIASFQDKKNGASSFDGYLREMDDERTKWFSEQYIYDSLDM